MKEVFNPGALKPVDETSYLTAQNAERYRAVMRYMYVQHQRMKYWIRKEEIYFFMKNYEIFSDYTMEDCQNDLKVLSEKKNLVAMQDTAKASPLEEFKNKRFKYKLSDFSIELERLLERMESFAGVKGSLEPRLFERIFEYIGKLEKLRTKPADMAAQWWRKLNRVFEDINKEYTDYISTLQSAKVESLMSTEGFLVYKDKLMNYLNQFINQLFQYQPVIEQQIVSLQQESVDTVLQNIIAHELSDPKNFMITDEAVLGEDVRNKWNNICKWFVNSEEESEAKALIEATTEIIRKITSYVLRIIENRNIAHNRKEEHKYLARLFADLSIEECAKLSSVTFGLFDIKQIKGDYSRESENIYLSVADTAPFNVMLKSRSRSFRERLRPNPVKEDKALREKAYEEYQSRKQKEQALLEEISKGGRICFDGMPVLTQEVRKQLLLWLQRGMNGKTARTDTGISYQVVLADKNKRCILKCTDGELDMPAYEIIFVRDESKW